MKEAISGTWVYITVLIFMVILIAYVSITINYSHAFEASESIIKAIEQYEGYNSTSRKAIADYIHNNTHTVKHVCNDGITGFQDTYGGIDNDKRQANGSNEKFDYCIARTVNVGADKVARCYYHTMVFFSFSLPVLGDLYAFQIPGETSGLRLVSDDTWGACQ